MPRPGGTLHNRYYGFVTGAMSAGYPYTYPACTWRRIRHETSLELRGDYCRSRDRRTGFSAAYRSRPLRANWYRSWRQSPRGARPIFSALQSTGRVAWPARCDTFVGGPDAGDDVPAARCDAPWGLDAITVTPAFFPLAGEPAFQVPQRGYVMSVVHNSNGRVTTPARCPHWTCKLDKFHPQHLVNGSTRRRPNTDLCRSYPKRRTAATLRFLSAAVLKRYAA